MRGKMVQSQWAVCSFDIDLQVAPCATPQRLKGAVGTAVGEDYVMEANGVPADDVIAIALL